MLQGRSWWGILQQSARGHPASPVSQSDCCSPDRNLGAKNIHVSIRDRRRKAQIVRPGFSPHSQLNSFQPSTSLSLLKTIRCPVMKFSAHQIRTPDSLPIMEKYQIDSGVDRGAKMGSSGLTSNDIKVVALGDSQAVVVFRRHLNKGREEEINGTRPG